MRAFIITGVLCTVVTALPGQSGHDSDQPRMGSTEQKNTSAAPADSIIASTYLLLHKGRKVVESWSNFRTQRTKVSTFSDKILQVRFLINSGKRTEALAALDHLRKQARKSALSPLDIFEVNHLTGQLYLEKRMPSHALHFFTEARRSLQAFQPEWQVRMKLYNDITESYLEKGAIRKGLRACDEFIAEIRHGNAGTSLFELTLQKQKARMYQRAGKHEEAIARFEYLIDAYPKFMAESDPAFVNLLSNLAKVYRANRDHHHAYVYLRWAYEKLQEQSVPDPEQVLDVITNLAEVYTVKGDDDSAKQYFDEARLLATAGKFR